MLLVKIFLIFARVGLFAVGGAYSFLPLLEKELVENYRWLSKPEFLDILGASQLFPGAISIKYATYTGYKIAGVPGAIMANLGNLAVPVVLATFIFSLYARYKSLSGVKGAFDMVQLVVFAMIIAAAFQLINVNQLMQLKSLLVIIVAFTLFMYTKLHPALIIIGAGILGALLK